jgi:hypothetical protein
MPEAISELYDSRAAWGSIFGIGGTTLWSICRPNFNPKYWATWYAAIGIASGKNAFAPIQADLLLLILINHHN